MQQTHQSTATVTPAIPVTAYKPTYSVSTGLRRILFGLLIILPTISACTTSGDALPTIALIDGQTPVIADDNTASVDATLPPGVRATLPPTFTPASADEVTQQPILIQSTNFVPVTPSDECVDLLVLFEQSESEFLVDTEPTVAWTGLPSARQYVLRLYNTTTLSLIRQFNVRETRFTFDADLFELGQYYAWEVYPENSESRQYCQKVGTEFAPYRPFGG